MPEQNIYQRAAGFTFKLAAGFLTTPLPKTVQAKLNALFVCMQRADSYVDAFAGREKRQAANNVLRYLGGNDGVALPKGELLDSLRDLRSFLDMLPPARKAGFLAETKNIFVQGDVLAEASSPRLFAKARTMEGIHTANLILLLVDEFGKNSAFSKFYRDISVTGSLLDSLIDARKDAANGEIAIKPERLYFTLAKESFKRGMAAFRTHPHKVRFAKMMAGWCVRHIRA